MDERHSPGADERSPTCLSFLAKLGRTPDKAGRQVILSACIKVRSPWVDELLWESLADANEGVRDMVTKELSYRQPLALGLALRRLRLPPWYAKSAALRILGCQRVLEAVPEIRRTADDANADVRRAAAEALSEIGGEEALRLLVRLKKDANPYVRAAAEEAIRKTSGVRFS
jgi:HEAT repeat protein